MTIYYVTNIITLTVKEYTLTI